MIDIDFFYQLINLNTSRPQLPNLVGEKQQVVFPRPEQLLVGIRAPLRLTPLGAGDGQVLLSVAEA